MKHTNTFVELKKFLQQPGVVFGSFPNSHALVAFLQQAKLDKRVIRLMYGETYDALGMTIDSLKYYFVLSQLHRLLEQEGFIVESTVLVADVASVLNKSVQNKEALLRDGLTRVAEIKKIIQVYGLKVKPVLMSDLFKQKQLQKTIEQVSIYAKNSKPVQKLFEKTVLKNKLAQERQTGFQYAAEGVATALQFDIKLGPPREQYYDKAARIISQALGRNMVYGLYLKPTYPLGKDFTFFISHAEIEAFGITPYKAGSNKLQDFRIILGKTSPETVKELLDTSFIAADLCLANPVVDLFLIADLAKRAVEKKMSIPFYPQDLVSNPDRFKQQTLENLQRYVFAPLRKGGLYE